MIATKKRIPYNTIGGDSRANYQDWFQAGLYHPIRIIRTPPM